MRILFISAAFLPEAIGGVELHLHGVAKTLRADHEVLVFCRGANSSRPEFDLERYEYEGVPVARLNYLWSDATRFQSVYTNPTIRGHFERLLDEFQPDVVHAHHLTCLSTDLLDAAKARGIGTLLTLHDFWMGCPRGQRMTPQLDLCEEVVATRCRDCLAPMWSGWFGEGRDGPGIPAEESRARDVAMIEEYHGWVLGVLERVDQLIAPSMSSRRLFERQGVAEGAIRVVENGLDARPFAGLSRESRPSGDPFRFGFIGSVLPTKGVHTLIDAFARLDDPSTRLDIYGEATGWHEVTDYGARLREQARPLGDRVTFHGRYGAEQLPSILRALDALVVPSLWFEAFCLTLREGFLANVPVIVSNLGAMAEGVVGDEVALRFKPGDGEDLARQMARLRSDADLRERLVRSPKQVRTIEENAAELLTCYVAVRRGEG